MNPSPPNPRRRRRPPGIDPGPRPLREVIEGAVERLGPHHGGRSPRVLALAEVVSHWEEIAGPGLAPHVRPLKLEGSTLVVAADHSARATQVRLLGAELIGRLRQATGEAGEEVVVDEVRVVVRPPS